MELQKALLKEHSKAQNEKIVKWVGNDKKRFAELMRLFFNGEYRLTQRAAWSMSDSVIAHPELVKPYIPKLIKLLKEPEVHGAVTRNIVRLLQEVEIPKKYHGEIMTICFDFIVNPKTAVAVKAFSITILENLAAIYPEIIPELKLIVQERWEHETPAFRQRGNRIMKL
jgi:hypothetical protein